LKLTTALGIKRGDSLAFVGAGGKTTAMFALAREMHAPVMLTTTTHLGSWQAGLADEHFIIHSADEIKEIDVRDKKIWLLTGPEGGDQRLRSLDQDSLETLRLFCQKRQLPLLIEADGACQRNLKAPEVYEPVIPNWVDHVVVLAGLAGLGKRLRDDIVHRPEQFSILTGLPLGAPIQIEDIIKMLAAKKGGLQGIPEGCKKLLFLNQAEGVNLQAAGAKIARELMGCYDRILVGSLKQPGPKGEIFAVHSLTAGVILAAGGSERLGTPKQLLNWGGQPYILQVVKTAQAAGLSPIIVITGADHQTIADILRGYSVQVIQNPNWRTGQSTTMKMGIKILPETVDSVVFLLSDQPQISPLLIRSLIEKRSVSRKPIIGPMSAGKRCNPVLFGQETFNSLLEVSGDMGGRALFNQFAVEWVPWIDSRIKLDVDLPGDEDVLWDSYFNIS
jgi:molybdenum cofactor cytidylyltransferase